MTDESNYFAADRRTTLKGLAASAAVLSSGISLARTASDADRKAIRAAVDAGFDESVKRIQEWIGVPTIAAEQLNIEKGVDYMSRLASDAGFQKVRRVPTGGVPAVFGTLDAGAKRTVGIYFMYDVKQYDPAEWASPPLEAQIFDHELGRAIRGRGAVNQKGPECAFLAALHAFRKAGKRLPVNLVLLAEGEEEIGSPNFINVFKDAEVLAAMRRADGVIIPGASQSANGTAGVSLGAKGIIECELVSTGKRWGRGPEHDVHSSLKAQVDSPVWHLVEALGTLVRDGGNTPAIDGWFEQVRPLSDRERELVAENARTRKRRRREEAARDTALDRRPAVAAITRETGLAADREYRRPGRRLHGPRRQDRSSGARSRQTGFAPRAEHDGSGLFAEITRAPGKARFRGHRGQHVRRLRSHRDCGKQ